MMRKFSKFIGAIFVFASTSAAAEIFVYVTDFIEIPVRSEQVINDDNIIRLLPSGTKVELLKTTEDGWTQIQFENTTGWMVSRYLQNDPIANIQLEKLKQSESANQLTINEQNAEIEKLKQTVIELGEENTELSAREKKALAEKMHIEKTYEEALGLEHANEKLNREILQLKGEIQILKKSNIAEQERTERNWFIVGALVLLAGMILGALIAKIKRRR